MFIFYNKNCQKQHTLICSFCLACPSCHGIKKCRQIWSNQPKWCRQAQLGPLLREPCWSKQFDQPLLRDILRRAEFDSIILVGWILRQNLPQSKVFQPYGMRSLSIDTWSICNRYAIDINQEAGLDQELFSGLFRIRFTISSERWSSWKLHKAYARARFFNFFAVRDFLWWWLP